MDAERAEEVIQTGETHGCRGGPVVVPERTQAGATALQGIMLHASHLAPGHLTFKRSQKYVF